MDESVIGHIVVFLDAAHFVPPYVALSRSDESSGELEDNEEKIKANFDTFTKRYNFFQSDFVSDLADRQKL